MRSKLGDFVANILKYAEIQKWDDATIDKKVEGLRKEIFDLRIQRATSGTGESHQTSVARKLIARLLTAKSQRRLAGVGAK